MRGEKRAFYDELQRVLLPGAQAMGFRPANMLGARTFADATRFDLPMIRLAGGVLDMLTLSMIPEMPGALYTLCNGFAAPDLTLADLDDADATAMLRQPLGQTLYALALPERKSWFRPKTTRAYAVEPKLPPDALRDAVTTEVARYLRDLQAIDARRAEAMRKTGIYRIHLREGVIEPGELIPGNSDTFRKLMPAAG